jgi:hypothetical protein
VRGAPSPTFGFGQKALGIAILSGFLKSRVYAKLLALSISERYQTFTGKLLSLNREVHDTGAYGIGK